MKTRILLIIMMAHSIVCHSQFNKSIDTRIETAAVCSRGNNSPLWLSANRYGLSSVNNNWGYLRGAVLYSNQLNSNWKIEGGVDLAAGYNMNSSVILQQAFAVFNYRHLFLSVGAKERKSGFVNDDLSSGMMVESSNARPIPQIRAGIDHYVDVPLTNGWVMLKGHVAYGKFFDNGWQRDFAFSENQYTKNTLYHSKSAFLKFGNKNILPLEMEIGFIGAAQFGGEKYIKGYDKPIATMPHAFSDYFRILTGRGGGNDSMKGEQTNALGNHLGSWNFALTGFMNSWRVRLYYEHMFEDGSGMFFGYGAWQDGKPGIEIDFPKHGLIDEVVYEMMGTKRQTCSIMSEYLMGIAPEIEMGRDNYYNNWVYLAWQKDGYGIGNPLITSPIYNKDGSITFKNNRVTSHHIAIGGHPSNEISYRAMFTYSDNYGTYGNPFDRRKSQIYSMLEIKYSPKTLKGWNFSVAAAYDKGSVIGNNKGGMITISKNFKQKIR